MSATKYLFCSSPREIKTITLLNYHFLENLAQAHFYDGEISAGVLATKTRKQNLRQRDYANYMASVTFHSSITRSTVCQT